MSQPCTSGSPKVACASDAEACASDAEACALDAEACALDAEACALDAEACAFEAEAARGVGGSIFWMLAFAASWNNSAKSALPVAVWPDGLSTASKRWLDIA